MILIGCTTIKPKETSIYNNNFTTLEIRSLWVLCQQAFLQKNPYTKPRVIIEYCDCYSDYVRKTYKDKKELNDLAIYDNLTKNLIIECNMKLQQEQSLADPASI